MHVAVGFALDNEGIAMKSIYFVTNVRAVSWVTRMRVSLAALFILLGIFVIAFQPASLNVAYAQSGYDPTVQTPSLLYDEARTVYLGNLARRDNGVPPLRWNFQLTQAARWFSWDSTENRPSGFCGHQDTLGLWPSDRAVIFGYLGSAGWENAFCGYVTPEYAIQGWMNSSGHRDNLLNTNVREIGLGYYRRSSDGRGYVTQDFGNDAVYAPVVIENEALSTTSRNVNLYIYDRSTGGGFAGFAPAAQMMISNDPYFDGVNWEPYSATKAWVLTDGSGWRDVFVKTRDVFNRSMNVSDTIYLGSNVPLNELGSTQMSSTQPQVTLYGLNGGSFPQVQFSLGWLADDTYGTFNKWWGNGERVNDPAAWGNTAYRLYPGDGESFAWVYDTSFIKDVPLVGYFRLKVNNNTSNNEVARISVTGGGTEYGPITLRGTDFETSNQYQEFALNFTFNSNPDDVFLIFNFWRSGSADVYVDTVSIFSVPQPVASPLVWSVPGGNYRGQGVWARYTDGDQFSNISEAVTVPGQIVSFPRPTDTPSPIVPPPDGTPTLASTAIGMLPYLTKSSSQVQMAVEATPMPERPIQEVPENSHQSAYTELTPIQQVVDFPNVVIEIAPEIIPISAQAITNQQETESFSPEMTTTGGASQLWWKCVFVLR